MTTLVDHTIDKMQYRCLKVSSSHLQTSQTYILTPHKVPMYVEAEIGTS